MAYTDHLTAYGLGQILTANIAAVHPDTETTDSGETQLALYSVHDALTAVAASVDCLDLEVDMYTSGPQRGTYVVGHDDGSALVVRFDGMGGHDDHHVPTWTLYHHRGDVDGPYWELGGMGAYSAVPGWAYGLRELAPAIVAWALSPDLHSPASLSPRWEPEDYHRRVTAADVFKTIRKDTHHG